MCFTISSSDLVCALELAVGLVQLRDPGCSSSSAAARRERNNFVRAFIGGNQRITCIVRKGTLRIVAECFAILSGSLWYIAPSSRLDKCFHLDQNSGASR